MKNKLIIGGAVLLFAIFGIAGSSDSSDQQQKALVQNTSSSAPAESTVRTESTAQEETPAESTPAPAPATPQATPPSTSSSSSSSSYTNVDGNTVRSPSYSSDGSVPAGATARCDDGTYSFSQHRSGTCSHHGGVATWL